jgi:predicted PurR-regulated permease PerM
MTTAGRTTNNATNPDEGRPEAHRSARSEIYTWLARGMGLAVGALLVLALANGIVLAGRVIVLVLVSILLASGLEPFIGWIRGHVNLGRGVTILVVYAAFFTAVLGLAFLVIPGALLQLNELTRNLPTLLSAAREWASGLQPNALGESVTAVIDTVGQTLQPAAPDAEGVLAAGLTVAEVVISVGSALAIVFFWLTEHARLQRYTLAFLPPERRAGAREAWNEIEGRLGSWVRGQLILMGTMGLATGTAYTLLGLEGAVLLGLVAALAEAIPLVGPALGAIPALLVAATQSPELVVLVALVYVVIQAVEGNVLVPVVMRNTVGISPFLVIVSILVGGRPSAAWLGPSSRFPSLLPGRSCWSASRTGTARLRSTPPRPAPRTGSRRRRPRPHCRIPRIRAALD